MSQPCTTTSAKLHQVRRFQTPVKLRMAAALLALSLGLLSLLPKSALATAPTLRLDVKRGTAVIVPPDAPRSHHGQERAAAQREVMRYEEARRTEQRKRWRPAVENRARQEAVT